MTPKELFHLAVYSKDSRFRFGSRGLLDFHQAGRKATLTLDEYPDREFEGTIARNSNAIDPATRTLNVEVDVDNPKGELLPGAYVFVHFKVPEHASNLMIPANTLLFRAQGLQVGVVRDGRVQLVPVMIGKDSGANVEICFGPDCERCCDSRSVRLPGERAGGAGEEQADENAKQMKKKEGASVTLRPAALARVAVLLLSGCMVGPKYVKPSVPMAPGYKEAGPDANPYKENSNWQVAQPADAAQRGDWWTIFGDAELNILEPQVAENNQNLKAADARFREARALIRFNHASLFPTVGVAPSAGGERESSNQPYFNLNNPKGNGVWRD